MIAAARQFTSAAEMRADYTAVHQRCSNPGVPAKPEPVVIEAAARFITRKVPLWKVKDTARSTPEPLAILRPRQR
jgi:hypothetical protein